MRKEHSRDNSHQEKDAENMSNFFNNKNEVIINNSNNKKDIMNNTLTNEKKFSK